MQLPISPWQDCSTDWQSAFIRDNSMLLSHQAWQGYLTQERGLVACNVAVGQSSYVANYKICYISLSQASGYLKKHHLKADVTNCLIDKMQTYRPEQEILVSIERQSELNISLLKNLAISPADCYQQVRNRWEEFYLEPRPMGGCL